VATGTKERELDLPQAKRFTGRGISYCAVCDGAFYRNQDVVVIGGGNSALEESLYLTSLVNKVYIVIRRDQYRAEAGVVDRVKANEKIELIVKHVPEALVIEDDKIQGIVLKNVDTGELQTIRCTGIFPYIGADPSTSFLDKSVLDERGYLVVDKNMATAIEGLYGAGDVCQKDLRQVVTATNDGAIAANSVIKYLQKH
ncbi:MAG: FAD-dependent oxidoreductase, partial [Erysipelotrichaceae bacterium]|nr:FAD-dependent oxidoreductase [Erysipelotrichaceae bacterium]